MTESNTHSARQSPGAGRLVFVKLGGSVITDKAQPETARREVIARLAKEVKRALDRSPHLQLLLAHGSGSFGHGPAKQFGTREGVHTAADWRGFAEVAAVAARLNHLVTGIFVATDVPVWSLQPSASAICRGGELKALSIAPIEQALDQGLVPLLYGDVALDETQGGTIISTEQIFAFLARQLHPADLVLTGVVDGVYDADPLSHPDAQPIPQINESNWASVHTMLGGSHATDVTGGMRTKIEQMVGLVRELPGLTVHIMSGDHEGALEAVLHKPSEFASGTQIRWAPSDQL